MFRKKSDYIKYLKRELNSIRDTSRTILIDSRQTKTGLWTIREQHLFDGEGPTRRVDLAVHVLNVKMGFWESRTFDVDSGPGAVDCPASLVKKWRKMKKKIPTWEGKGGHEEAWYDSWLKKQEVKEDLNTIQEGDTVVLYSGLELTFHHWTTKCKSQFVGQHKEHKRFRYEADAVVKVNKRGRPC